MQDRSSLLNVVYFGDTHGAITGDKLSGIGGFARISEAIRRYRAEHPNTLVLFGGDLLGASLYSQLFKGEADTELLKHMGVQAFALGNHDFHHGPEGLRKIIDQMDNTTPFLAANLDVSKEELLEDLIKSHHIFDVNGQKIAVVGVLTEETKNLKPAQLGNISFHDNLTRSVRQSIQTAKAEGADLVLVLSHLGYKEDKALATQLLNDGEDVIILGNHTHTVLGSNIPRMYFGASQGDYPTIIATDEGEQKAYITAAAHHGMALGTLNIAYSKHDNKTHITTCTGEPIVIHPDLPVDHEAEAIIEKYTAKIGSEYTDVIATTLVDLPALDCHPFAKPDGEDITRREENPLTNFVSDVIFNFAADYAKEKDLTPVDFALIHAGGMRADINEGEITRADISTLLQFNHNIVLVKMTGEEVKKLLEQCVYKEDFHRRSEFLIGSAGLGYQYDISQPRDARVTDVNVNGQAIDDQQTYCVAINSHMLGMKVAENLPTVLSQLSAENITILDKLDRDAVLEFCEKHKPTITGQLDGRLRCKQEPLLASYLISDVKYEDSYLARIVGRKREMKSLANAGGLSLFTPKEEAKSNQPESTPRWEMS